MRLRHRLRRSLRVRPEESRVALRVLLLMVVLWAGAAIGATGVESLFFARFGPEHLPWMYMALGLVTLPATLVISGVLGRSDLPRTLAALPLGMAVAVVAMRVALLSPGAWPFPTLWLSMMVLWIIHGTFSWGVAGMVHDARQAKRLFPLYGAGVILGGAVGGLATGPLAALLGAENLLAVWATTLAAAHVLARRVTGDARVTARGRSQERGRFLEGVRRGASFVRRSSLLLWMSAAMVLLALLYFSLSLYFAQAATQRFPDEDRLAAFLGLLQGVTYAGALGVSLLLANRFFARLGVATAALSFPLLYLLGFAAVAVSPGFEPLVAFRFAQLLWMFGVWQTAWQAMFNVVPPEQRAGARMFMDGVPMQAGIFLAGAVLLLAREALSPRQLFVVAASVAGGAAIAAVGARRAYTGAIADALRAGWPEVFVPEVEPFGGIVWDRAALSALARGVRDPDPGTRRIAMEIVGQVPAPEAQPLRLAGLADEDPGVRAAALAALVRFPDAAAASRALALLSDPEPVIRAAALDATVVCVRRGREAAAAVSSLLEDADPAVRVRAAVALRRLDSDPRAMEILEGMAASREPERRAVAVAALGEVGAPAEAVAGALGDRDPRVRRAAVEALASLEDGAAAVRLVPVLADEDPGVRATAAAALARLGPDAEPGLRAALADQRTVEGALAALARLPMPDPEPVLRVAAAARDAALHWHRRWRALVGEEDERLGLLAFSVRDRALREAALVLRAEAAVGDAEAIEIAIENLESGDGNQRANALEMIEAVGRPDLVRPLLPVWDPEPDPGADAAGAVWEMIDDEDPWIRACAVLAAAALEGPAVARTVARALEDPDSVVRETAARVAGGEERMETLTTMTLMDRVLALRQVPLFRALSPADLKLVAEATTEHLYPAGTHIARVGEPGDALHVVVSGEVRVLAGDREGEAWEVSRFGPGYIVGEMAIISGQPRTATLEAVGEVRSLSLDRARFQRIIRERPDAALAVMRELCDRLRESSARGSPGGGS